MTEEVEATTPDIVQDFQALLQKYGLKEGKARTIARYIVDTEQPDVFDDPEALTEKLAKWPRDIQPVTGRRCGALGCPAWVVYPQGPAEES